MKILLLSREYPPIVGGAGMICKHLAEQWVKLGHQVDVVTGYGCLAPAHEVLNGVNVYRVNVLSKKEKTTPIIAAFYILFGTFKAIELSFRNRYDVINTHFAALAGPIGVIVSKLFKTQNILTIIGGDIYEPTLNTSPHNNFALKLIVRFVLNNSNKIIAISNNTKENAEKYYKPNKKIAIIPVGFNPQKFEILSREKLKMNPDSFYFISVGRLAIRKNFSTLLRAFSMITNKKSELIFLGDGPQKTELQNLAKDLGVNDRVNFLGSFSSTDEKKKFQYIKMADVFALPSIHEGFGVAFQEAMYCGVPIVAGNYGGQNDFLENRRNALLVSPQDVEGLYVAMKELMESKELRDKLSKEAEKDLEKFYIDNVAREYISIMR